MGDAWREAAHWNNARVMKLQLSSGTVSGELKALETSSILGESYVERQRKSILR